MNYYQHNLGDYAQATAHLSLIEDAVYSRLLRKYYADESPLPNNLVQLQRWVGARTDDERAAVDVVLAEFFTLESDGWHQKRCDEEIADYQAKAETARKNGQRGGRPRQFQSNVLRATKPDGNPEETQLVLYGLATGTHIEPEGSQEETGSKAKQEPRTSNQSPSPSGDGSAQSRTAPPRKPLGLSDLVEAGVGEQHAADWLAVRKAKRAALTQTALDEVRTQAAKAGISLDDAVRIAAARGWQGFRADWDWNAGTGRAAAPVSRLKTPGPEAEYGSM